MGRPRARAHWTWRLVAVDERYALLGILALSACVLPADEPTGVELSWRLIEVNTVDGEEAQRARTCDGGHIDELVFAITDTGDPTRSDTFRYPCSYGYQTLSEFQTESSDAFIELRPHRYAVQIDLVGATPEGDEVVRRARDLEVNVLDRTVTLQDFDFGLEPVELAFSLQGTDSCDQAGFSLRYRDPEMALAEPPRGDDGDTIDPLVYREALSTDLGLSLAGAVTPCPDLAPEHVVSEVDPGDYILDVDVDGTVCPVDVVVGLRGATHVIDLANLPCDG